MDFTEHGAIGTAVGQHQRVTAALPRRHGQHLRGLGEADRQATIPTVVARILLGAARQALLIDGLPVQLGGGTALPGHLQAQRRQLPRQQVVVWAVGRGGLRDDQVRLADVPVHIDVIGRWPCGIGQVGKAPFELLLLGSTGRILG